ncbi:hypothetical protein SAMN05421827_1494 [Pedobacter terrae]|uniref:Uncharacterized protein n=1 Tax=Pedobacter terrae TaxID=405671 RepID=A0A1G8ESB8_9SPHI|nr:hypothetical protein SAMN05421827_1494 [Pedobacter terrae]
MLQNINSILDLNDLTLNSYNMKRLCSPNQLKASNIYSHYNINKLKLFEKEINKFTSPKSESKGTNDISFICIKVVTLFWSAVSCACRLVPSSCTLYSFGNLIFQTILSCPKRDTAPIRAI